MSYHGYGIAALAFSAMISAPIYARIGDKLMSCKIVLRVGIVFSIVGNFVYFAFPNANMIIVARMISGLGWGLEGSFYSSTAGPWPRQPVFNKQAQRQVFWVKI